MATTSAADLMNRTYRYQRHIYNFTRKYYLLGRDRLIAEIDAGDGVRVLEIGCGTGRNLILAARRYPGARCFGIDLSTEMLNSAIRAIVRAGLAARISVAHGDATRFDPQSLFGIAQFDRIFFSYSLSMIPRWHDALDMAIALLAPNGELRVIDFGGQERLPGAFRRLLRRWLVAFHVVPRDKLEAILTARATATRATIAFERPYRGYAQYATLRREPIRKSV
ncbi:MAG TPA: class I SAM-dependent methyltransferase [Xanthobacteraceae bacterium]|nr:class I SAM-dependent methyltransferase [Xanthobacteraceae bacterium]